MSERFDVSEALKTLQSGQPISGKGGILAPLIKQLTEAALEAELESHLTDDVLPNRKKRPIHKDDQDQRRPYRASDPA